MLLAVGISRRRKVENLVIEFMKTHVNLEDLLFCDNYTEKKIFFNDVFKLESKKKINSVLIGPEGGFYLSEKKLSEKN